MARITRAVIPMIQGAGAWPNSSGTCSSSTAKRFSNRSPRSSRVPKPPSRSSTKPSSGFGSAAHDPSPVEVSLTRIETPSRSQDCARRTALLAAHVHRIKRVARSSRQPP
jgi:hypothetical protein